MANLSGKTVAFLAANEGVEQIELTSPWQAVEQAGGRPVLLAPQAGKIQAFNHLDKADTFEAQAVTGASVGDYDELVLPGGVANPDQLRMDSDAVSFIREFAQSGKPVAVICHGPWTLVEADCVRGRRLTSWPSLQTDIRNAGGEWVDEGVVIDRNGPGPLITSRKPSDLDAFCEAVVDAGS